MKLYQKIALLFSVIGAINWGLIGLFRFNLVSFLFGTGTFLANIVYMIVGICGIINLALFFEPSE